MGVGSGGGGGRGSPRRGLIVLFLCHFLPFFDLFSVAPLLKNFLPTPLVTTSAKNVRTGIRRVNIVKTENYPGATEVD